MNGIQLYAGYLLEQLDIIRKDFGLLFEPSNNSVVEQKGIQKSSPSFNDLREQISSYSTFKLNSEKLGENTLAYKVSSAKLWAGLVEEKFKELLQKLQNITVQDGESQAPLLSSAITQIQTPLMVVTTSQNDPVQDGELKDSHQKSKQEVSTDSTEIQTTRLISIHKIPLSMNMEEEEKKVELKSLIPHFESLRTLLDELPQTLSGFNFESLAISGSIKETIEEIKKNTVSLKEKLTTLYKTYGNLPNLTSLPSEEIKLNVRLTPVDDEISELKSMVLSILEFKIDTTKLSDNWLTHHTGFVDMWAEYLINNFNELTMKLKKVSSNPETQTLTIANQVISEKFFTTPQLSTLAQSTDEIVKEFVDIDDDNFGFTLLDDGTKNK